MNGARCFAGLSRAALAILASVLAGCSGEPAAEEIHRAPTAQPAANGTTAVDPTYSKFLEARLVVPPGVFPPAEAEALLLPFLQEHADLFPQRRVLDIGSGTGIVGLYAARLGAAAVVATDIDPTAIGAIRENASRLDLDRVVDARLVKGPDTSAYAVVRPGERFDVIVSNPPYSLDLDAAQNTPLVDTGDLGFSILEGLDQRLKPGGVAILLYNSLFYHRLMVQLARHLGHEVRHHDAYGLTSWELEALFNVSARRVLEREGIAPDAFTFDAGELPMLRSLGSTSSPDALLGRGGRVYPGLIVVRPRSDGATDHAGHSSARERASDVTTPR